MNSMQPQARKRSEQDRRWARGDSEQTLESKEDDNPAWPPPRRYFGEGAMEREFVVDSGTSMRMPSRYFVLVLLMCRPIRVSRSPTRVITANGEVHTNEEATEYV